MQKIQNYFELLRSPKTLIGSYFAIKMGLLNIPELQTHMSISVFLLLILALFLIGIGGYLIHDIHSIEADKINYPNKVLVEERVSIGQAKILYWIFSITGIILGLIVSTLISNPSYGLIFIILAGIPYLYATRLKNAGIIGNLVIASLGLIAFCIPIAFDIFPSLNSENSLQHIVSIKILLLYGGFAFALIYIEMLIANIRSLPGDRKLGVRTIANDLGFDKTKSLTLIASIIILTLMIYSVVRYLETKEVILYFIFAVIAPFIYFIIQLYYLKLEKMVNQINILYNILRIVYTTGFISIILLNYFN